jgi:hypothetical protein
MYERAEVKLNGGRGACLCDGCGVILSYGFDHADVEHYCGECYNKLFQFVKYIALDYVELSYEKVRIQRDDYIRMAGKLLNDE